MHFRSDQHANPLELVANNNHSTLTEEKVVRRKFVSIILPRKLMLPGHEQAGWLVGSNKYYVLFILIDPSLAT